MSSEAGRLLLKDMINFKESGFNPFDRETILSKRFWKFRLEYGKVSFGAFKTQALKLADIAIVQMPKTARMREEKRLKGLKTKTTTPTKTTDEDLGLVFSKLRVQNKTPNKSLRDVIVAEFPNGKKVLVLFEPDGDVDDETSNKLQFSEDGKKIVRWCRVPKEWRNAAALIGTAKQDNDTDGDCMLLGEEIKRRIAGAEEDENGVLWEPREVIKLPFSCHKKLFGKRGQEISTYLIRKNTHDYAWGYFWLLSAQVKLGDDDENISLGRFVGEDDCSDEEASWQETGSSDDDLSSIASGGFDDIDPEDLMDTEEEEDERQEQQIFEDESQQEEQQ